MKTIILILSIFSSSVFASTVPKIVQDKMQLICDQFNGHVNYDYAASYASEVTDRFSKSELDDIYKSLSDGFGHCVSFSFPDYESTPRVVHIKTDKGLTVNWGIALNSDGLINVFYQKGVVTDFELEITEKMVEMRDGVKLYTRIYRKKGETRTLPTVLTRTPYLNIIPWRANAEYIVGKGYNFVVQSIRGRDNSEGTYRIFSRTEGPDGYDAIEWIAKQEFSTPNIGITGTSYDGFTALAAGVLNPPSLKVIFSGGAPSEIRYSALSSNGIILSSMLDYLRYNFSFGEEVFTAGMNGIIASKISIDDKIEDYDEALFERDIQEWNDLVAAVNFPEQNKQFYFERSVYDQIKDIKIPTYHIGGLRQDGDLVDTVRNFKESDRSANRNYHHLILGFWDHSGSTPYGEVGAADFIQERFEPLLGHYLLGKHSEYTSEPRVAMQSDFAGVFKFGDTFPLESKSKRLYFTNDSLLSEILNHEEIISLSVNPFSDNENGLKLIEFEADKDITMFGTPVFDFFVKSELPSFDLLVNFYKIDSTGEYQFISNCIEGKNIQNTNPNEITKLSIDFEFCPILATLSIGEKLGVAISTNRFPVTFLNYNNKSKDGFISGSVDIISSKEFPSSLSLKIK